MTRMRRDGGHEGTWLPRLLKIFSRTRTFLASSGTAPSSSMGLVCDLRMSQRGRHSVKVALDFFLLLRCTLNSKPLHFLHGTFTWNLWVADLMTACCAA